MDLPPIPKRLDPDAAKAVKRIGDAAMAVWLNPPKPREPTEAELEVIADAFDVPVAKLRQLRKDRNE